MKALYKGFLAALALLIALFLLDSSTTRGLFGEFGVNLNYKVKSIFTSDSINKLSLNITTENWDMIEEMRDTALLQQTIPSSSKRSVDVNIVCKNSAQKGKIRLKGHLKDHISDPIRWSFKINLDSSKSCDKVRCFSIHRPVCRGYLNEWVFQEMLKYHGLISTYYTFKQLELNGKELGLYAFEENMKSHPLNHDTLETSLLLWFEDDYYWQNLPNLVDRRTYAKTFARIFNDGFTHSKVVFGNKNDPRYFTAQHKIVVRIDSLTKGEIHASEVFDMEQMATLYAITDLFGSDYYHPLWYHNLKFYVSPKTGLFQPIASDLSYLRERAPTQMSGSYNNELIGENPDGWFGMIIHDPVFQNHYFKALEKVSKKNTLKNFFNSIDSETEYWSRIIQRDYPGYYFNSGIIYKNASQNRDYIAFRLWV